MDQKNDKKSGKKNNKKNNKKSNITFKDITHDNEDEPIHSRYIQRDLPPAANLHDKPVKSSSKKKFLREEKKAQKEFENEKKIYFEKIRNFQSSPYNEERWDYLSRTNSDYFSITEIPNDQCLLEIVVIFPWNLSISLLKNILLNLSEFVQKNGTNIQDLKKNKKISTISLPQNFSQMQQKTPLWTFSYTPLDSILILRIPQGILNILRNQYTLPPLPPIHSVKNTLKTNSNFDPKNTNFSDSSFPTPTLNIHFPLELISEFTPKSQRISTTPDSPIATIPTHSCLCTYINGYVKQAQNLAKIFPEHFCPVTKNDVEREYSKMLPFLLHFRRPFNDSFFGKGGTAMNDNYDYHEEIKCSHHQCFDNYQEKTTVGVFGPDNKEDVLKNSLSKNNPPQSLSNPHICTCRFRSGAISLVPSVVTILTPLSLYLYQQSFQTFSPLSRPYSTIHPLLASWGSNIRTMYPKSHITVLHLITPAVGGNSETKSAENGAAHNSFAMQLWKPSKRVRMELIMGEKLVDDYPNPYNQFIPRGAKGDHVGVENGLSFGNNFEKNVENNNIENNHKLYAQTTTALPILHHLNHPSDLHTLQRFDLIIGDRTLKKEVDKIEKEKQFEQIIQNVQNNDENNGNNSTPFSTQTLLNIDPELLPDLPPIKIPCTCRICMLALYSAQITISSTKKFEHNLEHFPNEFHPINLSTNFCSKFRILISSFQSENDISRQFIHLFQSLFKSFIRDSVDTYTTTSGRIRTGLLSPSQNFDSENPLKSPPNKVKNTLQEAFVAALTQLPGFEPGNAILVAQKLSSFSRLQRLFLRGLIYEEDVENLAKTLVAAGIYGADKMGTVEVLDVGLDEFEGIKMNGVPPDLDEKKSYKKSTTPSSSSSSGTPAPIPIYYVPTILVSNMVSTIQLKYITQNRKTALSQWKLPTSKDLYTCSRCCPNDVSLSKSDGNGDGVIGIGGKKGKGGKRSGKKKVDGGDGVNMTMRDESDDDRHGVNSNNNDNIDINKLDDDDDDDNNNNNNNNYDGNNDSDIDQDVKFNDTRDVKRLAEMRKGLKDVLERNVEKNDENDQVGKKTKKGKKLNDFFSLDYTQSFDNQVLQLIHGHYHAKKALDYNWDNIEAQNFKDKKSGKSANKKNGSRNEQKNEQNQPCNCASLNSALLYLSNIKTNKDNRLGISKAYEVIFWVMNVRHVSKNA
jgi:hypothetical protein